MARNYSSVVLAAPERKVWAHLNEPHLVKQWQYGELSTDWSIGGAIHFKTEWESQIFEQWGTVLEYCPNQSLRYSLFAPRPGLADQPENYFEME